MGSGLNYNGQAFVFTSYQVRALTTLKRAVQFLNVNCFLAFFLQIVSGQYLSCKLPLLA